MAMQFPASKKPRSNVRLFCFGAAILAARIPLTFLSSTLPAPVGLRPCRTNADMALCRLYKK
jgi:hypothetical protein